LELQTGLSAVALDPLTLPVTFNIKCELTDNTTKFPYCTCWSSSWSCKQCWCRELSHI